ncbi:MAG: hypothetical protein ACD_29C00098G0001, partial [uncultured bacterium]
MRTSIENTCKTYAIEVVWNLLRKNPAVNTLFHQHPYLAHNADVILLIAVLTENDLIDEPTIQIFTKILKNVIVYSQENIRAPVITDPQNYDEIKKNCLWSFFSILKKSIVSLHVTELLSSENLSKIFLRNNEVRPTVDIINICKFIAFLQQLDMLTRNHFNNIFEKSVGSLYHRLGCLAKRFYFLEKRLDEVEKSFFISIFCEEVLAKRKEGETVLQKNREMLYEILHDIWMHGPMQDNDFGHYTQFFKDFIGEFEQIKFEKTNLEKEIGIFFKNYRAWQLNPIRTTGF